MVAAAEAAALAGEASPRRCRLPHSSSIDDTTVVCRLFDANFDRDRSCISSLYWSCLRR